MSERKFCQANNTNKNIWNEKSLLKLDKSSNIAKKLAELLCNQNNNNGKIIKILMKLFVSHEHHISIDGTNHETFLKSFPLCNDYVDLTEEPAQPDFPKEIIGFYDTYAARCVTKETLCDQIKSYDRWHLNDVDYGAFSESNSYREPLPKQSFSLSKKIEAPNNRVEDIRLCYVVLELNAAVQKIAVGNVLKKLQKYETLHIFEQIFLEYILKNCDWAVPEIVEKFPEVIETAVIELCINILKDPNVGRSNADLFIKNVSQGSKQCVILQILSISYELYALSNYNENLMGFIKFLKELKVD